MAEFSSVHREALPRGVAPIAERSRAGRYEIGGGLGCADSGAARRIAGAGIPFRPVAVSNLYTGRGRRGGLRKDASETRAGLGV